MAGAVKQKKYFVRFDFKYHRLVESSINSDDKSYH